MAAYAIYSMQIKDLSKVMEYGKKAGETVAARGGKYIVRAPAQHVVEGDRNWGFVVIVEFPTMDALQAWHDSEEYRAVMPLRQEAADSEVLFIQGLG